MPTRARKPTCAQIRNALMEYQTTEGAIDGPLVSRVGERIRRHGYLGPDDLYLIVVWKSVARFALMHARGVLQKNPPKRIEDTTRKALSQVATDSSVEATMRAIETLSELRHVGIPIASAILAFYDPERFGAIDPNAWEALGWSDDRDWEPRDYGRYLIRVREIARDCGLTPREVDCALYQMGGTRTPSQRGNRSKRLSENLRKSSG